MDGCVGENVKFAFAADNVPETLRVRDEVDVAFVSLVTLRTIVNVPFCWSTAATARMRSRKGIELKTL